jgi:hypothetical protein
METTRLNRSNMNMPSNYEKRVVFQAPNSNRLPNVLGGSKLGTTPSRIV